MMSKIQCIWKQNRWILFFSIRLIPINSDYVNISRYRYWSYISFISSQRVKNQQAAAKELLSTSKVHVGLLCCLFRPSSALLIYPAVDKQSKITADTLLFIMWKVLFPHLCSLISSPLLTWMRTSTHSADSQSTCLCTHISTNAHKHTYVCAKPHQQSLPAEQTQNLSEQNLHTKLQTFIDLKWALVKCKFFRFLENHSFYRLHPGPCSLNFIANNLHV